MRPGLQSYPITPTPLPRLAALYPINLKTNTRYQSHGEFSVAMRFVLSLVVVASGVAQSLEVDLA